MDSKKTYEYNVEKLLELLDNAHNKEELKKLTGHADSYYREALENENEFKVGNNVYFKDSKNNERRVGVIRRLGLVRHTVDILIGNDKGEWQVPYRLLGHATKDDLLQLSILKMSK